MDQDQLAEISSLAIPSAKAINNGEDQRDETSRQGSSVALTMRGFPSFVFPKLTFYRKLNHKKKKKKQMEINLGKNTQQVLWLRQMAGD